MNPTYNELRSRLAALDQDGRRELFQSWVKYRAAVQRAAWPWFPIGLTLVAIGLVTVGVFWLLAIENPARLDRRPLWADLGFPLQLLGWICIFIGDRRSRRFERHHRFEF